MRPVLDRVRLTTLAISTAAFIAISATALAQSSERPTLDVPYVPTPPEVVERMLQMADVRAGDYVIDLGCGDGRIAIAAAKRGAKALGVDIDPARIEDANENARKEDMIGKVSFRRQNLFETEIGEASVITMYLLTAINLKLRPRLLELKAGTRIVSHAFELGEWRPDEIAQVGFRHAYLWIVPAKVGGRWRMQAGGETLTLKLDQTFQRITGQIETGGKTVAVTGGKLNGAEIDFTLADGRTLKGRVDGNRMQSLPGTTSWQATRAS
jgi:SAM-dependent methyltransferase